MQPAASTLGPALAWRRSGGGRAASRSGCCHLRRTELLAAQLAQVDFPEHAFGCAVFLHEFAGRYLAALGTLRLHGVAGLEGRRGFCAAAMGTSFRWLVAPLFPGCQGIPDPTGRGVVRLARASRVVAAPGDRCCSLRPAAQLAQRRSARRAARRAPLWIGRGLGALFGQRAQRLHFRVVFHHRMHQALEGDADEDRRRRQGGAHQVSQVGRFRHAIQQRIAQAAGGALVGRDDRGTFGAGDAQDHVPQRLAFQFGQVVVAGAHLAANTQPEASARSRRRWAAASSVRNT